MCTAVSSTNRNNSPLPTNVEPRYWFIFIRSIVCTRSEWKLLQHWCLLNNHLCMLRLVTGVSIAVCTSGGTWQSEAPSNNVSQAPPVSAQAPAPSAPSGAPAPPAPPPLPPSGGGGGGGPPPPPPPPPSGSGKPPPAPSLPSVNDGSLGAALKTATLRRTSKVNGFYVLIWLVYPDQLYFCCTLLYFQSAKM